MGQTSNDPADPKTYDKSRGHKTKQVQQVDGIGIGIEASDALPQGIDSIAEGHKGVENLIDPRQDLNGKGSSAPCHLDDHDHNADGLSDCPEGIGQGIEKKGKYQTGYCRRQPEEKAGLNLNPHVKEGPKDNDQGLYLPQEKENQIATPELVPWLNTRDLPRMLLAGAKNRHLNQGPDPNGQNDIEGRHSRTVICNGIGGFAFQSHRGRNEIRNQIRIRLNQLDQHAVLIRRTQLRDLVDQVAKLSLHLGQMISRCNQISFGRPG